MQVAGSCVVVIISNDREWSGKKLAEIVSRHHISHMSVCLRECVSVYVQIGSSDREEKD